MDSTAIHAISELAIDAAGLNRLGTNTPAIFHDGDLISLERLQEGRSRFRGAYTTNSLESFAGYVSDTADETEDGACFVDADAMTARAFFNLGTAAKPGHGDWTATLKLKKTPEYDAMLGVNGKKLDQRALVEWMEDWAANIEAIQKDGAVIPAAKALGAIRKLTIKATSEATHQDKDFGARRSAIEDIEASADGGIPYALSFAVVPYTGLSQRTFTLRLSILTGDDKPQLVLRPIALESAVNAIADEFRAVLTKLIGESADVRIGNFTP